MSFVCLALYERKEGGIRPIGVLRAPNLHIEKVEEKFIECVTFTILSRLDELMNQRRR